MLANGDGTEYVFTILMEDDIDQAGLTGQIEVIEQELATVRDLMEAGDPTAALACGACGS